MNLHATLLFKGLFLTYVIYNGIVDGSSCLDVASCNSLWRHCCVDGLPWRVRDFLWEPCVTCLSWLGAPSWNWLCRRGCVDDLPWRIRDLLWLDDSSRHATFQRPLLDICDLPWNRRWLVTLRCRIMQFTLQTLLCRWFAMESTWFPMVVMLRCPIMELTLSM